MLDAFFNRHPVIVAHDLIGCELTVARDGVLAGGRIVETEAYAGPADPASHSARLKLARSILGGPTGHVYVYRSYGIHLCLNIVSHEPGEGGGVLIRAIDPTIGLEIMRERRGEVPDTQLGRGPGNVGQALAVSLDDVGSPVNAGGDFAVTATTDDVRVLAGPRIGISKAVDAPWRFFDPDSKAVSSHRKGADVGAESLLEHRDWLSSVE